MKLVLAVATSIAVTGITGAACAQTYPDRPIRITVGFPPSAIDATARLMATEMQKKLGQPIVVEPIISANGIVAARAVVQSKPDGYNLHYGPMTGMSPIYHAPDVAIDAARDLAAVSNIAITPYMLVVSAKLPVTTLKELVDYSKANPGKINNGVNTVGGSLPAAILKKETGIDYVDIPYKTSALVVQAMMMGDVAMSIAGPSTFVNQYRSGAVRPIFITIDKRMASIPNVPTTRELGLKELTVGINFGFWATKGTPPAVIQKLNEVMVSSVRNPEIAEKFRSDAYLVEPVGSTPEELVEAYRNEYRFISEGIKLTGYKRQ